MVGGRKSGIHEGQGGKNEQEENEKDDEEDVELAIAASQLWEFCVYETLNHFSKDTVRRTDK